MKHLLILLLISTLYQSNAQNSLPIVSIVNGVLDLQESTLEIEYNISDTDDSQFEVNVWYVLQDNLEFSLIDQSSIDGDIGTVNGTGDKSVIINLNNIDLEETESIRIVVDDLYEINILEIVNSVDTNRIKSNLSNIEGIRHYQADPEHLEEVRQLIIDHHVLMNRDTLIQKVIYNTVNEGKNIFGIQDGIFSKNIEYFIGGHYDGVEEGPGADDNGTAVAAMLEVSEIFKDFNFKKGIRYVAWDFEEQGLIGSAHFVNNKSSELSIPGYLNFEMIGYYTTKPNTQDLPFGFDLLFPDAFQEIEDNDFRGDFLTNVGNATASNQLMLDFEAIATQYVPELSVISIASPGNGTSVPDLLRSDHAPFWIDNIPAVMLTDGANFRNKNYHTDKDVMDSLDFNFLMQNVKASVAYLAEKAEIIHASAAQINVDSLLISNNENALLSQSFKLQPTISSDKLYIINKSDQVQNYEYQIFTYSGNLVKEGTSDLSEQVINIASLEAGYYFLKIKTDRERVTFKFVKIG